MELTTKERKKRWMVKAEAYLKAGKAKKSAMLDDFCESTGYCRRHTPSASNLAAHGHLHPNDQTRELLLLMSPRAIGSESESEETG
jgi:hypothetical protein